MSLTSSPRVLPRTRRRRVGVRAGAALTGLALAATALATPAFAGQQQARTSSTKAASLVVETAYGKVEGVSVDGAQAFLGLPFAQPPVYDLAWKAPVEPERWRGTRDATEQAPACLQMEPTGVKNDQPTSLDCLYLDVYRPARMSKQAKLPVVVFYHGGGSTQGSGVLYGGQTMVERNNVIFISTNYRLGAAGTLVLPELVAEDPATGGNFALLDQVQALKWVQTTVEDFGGDPDNVTIVGQSAGARAVCNLLATPLTEGMIHRAVMQSSPCLGGGGTQSSALNSGGRYATAAGCPAGEGQLACLRNAWPGALVTAQGVVGRTGGYVGTPTLPQASGDAIAAGNWHKVPVIVGNTRWEQRLQNMQYADITAAEYEQMVMTQFGPNAGPLVLAQYPASAYEKPFYALAAMRTDNGAGCQIDTNAKLFLAQGVPVYRYLFEDPTSPTLFGFQPEGIDMSSAHSVELAYLFDFTLGDRPLTAQQSKLGRAMQDYWTSFARTGTPAAKGLPVWPRYTLERDEALVFGPKIHVTTGLHALHNCDFWAGLPR